MPEKKTPPTDEPTPPVEPQTSYSSRQISPQIYAWVDQALEEHPDGTDVRWDGQFTVTSKGPLIAVFFTLPGAVLGTEVRTIAQFVELTRVDYPAVEHVVGQTVESLHQARSAQLAEEVARG